MRNNTLSDLRNTMTPEKRKNAKNDFFAFYVGRPLSYYLTVPAIWLKLSPTSVTVMSMVVLLASSVTFMISDNKNIAILAWVLLFLWNLLDGVDGNIARLKKVSSPLGSVWDAMSGYASMFATFFAFGVFTQNFTHNQGYLYVLLGALGGVAQIFPRLVAQKARNTLEENVEVMDKANFSFSKIVALNLTSVTGFPQPLMLISIIVGVPQLFIIFYFVINSAVMVVSLKSVLR